MTKEIYFEILKCFCAPHGLFQKTADSILAVDSTQRKCASFILVFPSLFHPET